ncbi:hypothetical protein [Nonomuraea sp. NPDC048826]|uniref:hypothetical protein n=1 Tax=Nonomuraea sp. NPDC048826 TaxID=3364347 RepID=UPI003713D432
MQENNTVNVHGGSVSGPVAVGHRAKAVAHTPGSPELRALLDRLAGLVDEHEAHVAEPGRARRDVADVRDELAEPEPDRDRVLDALRRLSRRAAEVTAITDMITRIRDLLP